MEIFGRLFLFVWCGVFGRREIVGVLNTLSVPCLISSFYFSKPYLTGSPCGETNLFLLFWIYLTFVMFVFDLFTLVYSLCIWVPLSFWYQWIFSTYQKKNKGQINLVWWLSTPLTNCWQIVVKVSYLYISFESKIVHSCFRSPSFLHYLMSKSSSNEIFFCFCTENCNVFLLLLIYFFYHLAPIKDSLLHKENSEQT